MVCSRHLKIRLGDMSTLILGISNPNGELACLLAFLKKIYTLLDFFLSNYRSTSCYNKPNDTDVPKKGQHTVSPSLPKSYPIRAANANSSECGLPHSSPNSETSLHKHVHSEVSFVFLFLENKNKITQHHYLANCFFI